jgi:predicted nucleic acid-binding protein
MRPLSERPSSVSNGGRTSAAALFLLATSFTIVPAFVDSNILVYAEDLDAGSKHEIARDLVADLWRSGEGVLSIQVLQEFFVNVTRKIPRPLKPAATLAIVEQYLTWRVVENTGDLLLAGIRLSSTLKISFWDALIVQAARMERCDRLWTEDLNHGQRVGDLTHPQSLPSRAASHRRLSGANRSPKRLARRLLSASEPNLRMWRVT